MAVTNNAAPSRIGQVNASGDAKALFLKVFAGEVLATFAEVNVMMPLHRVRTIKSGKSASFPAVGTATAAYHTPGESLIEGDNGYLNQVKHNERLIHIDDQLVAPVFVSNLDEAMNHYDVRGEYSTQMGRALSNTADKNLIQKVLMAAREAATITGGNAGTKLSKGATVASTATVLAAAIFEAAQTLDEKDVPEEDRYCVLLPKYYYLLAQESTKVINRDVSGAGSYADGEVLRIAGVQLIKSNHVPSTDLSAAISGDNNDYTADFSDTVATVFQKSAIGTTKLLDLAVESAYQIERQGWLFVGKYAMGHGTLRPESAVEISKAS